MNYRLTKLLLIASVPWISNGNSFASSEPGESSRCLPAILQNISTPNTVALKKIETLFETKRLQLKIQSGDLSAVHFPKNPEKRLPLPWTRESLLKMDIPEPLHDLYDLKTGTIRLPTPQKNYLSSETGRERLKMIRIAMGAPNRKSSPISEDLFREYLQVMEEIPDLKLYVTYDPRPIVKYSQTKLNELLPPEINRILENSKKSVRKRITFVDAKNSPSTVMWTQDGSKPLISAEHKTAISGFEGRPEYAIVLNRLKRDQLLKTEKAMTPFEGGNVVVGDHHIFTGADTAQRLMEYYRIPRKTALKIMEQEWGKPVLEIGTVAKHSNEMATLDYHLDLTLSIAYNHKTGKETIVLGSFQEFLNQMKTISPNEFKTNFEKDFLQKIQNPKLIEEMASRENQLDVVEAQLRMKGYEVRRVPNVILDENKPILNYTNVVYSGNKMLFPESGIRAIDQRMKLFFKEMGYDPIPMKVVQKSMLHMGGLRCLSETYRCSNAPVPFLNRPNPHKP